MLFHPLSQCFLSFYSWGLQLFQFHKDLFRYLPFDEDVIPRLFHKIKTADYEIPNHVSNEAKDLISRIF